MAFESSGRAELRRRFLARLDVAGNVTVVAREWLRVDYAAGTATMGDVTSPGPGLAALDKQFSMATGMPVYFCDPASPWQRGTN